ncbi:MAG: tetratricopeptide repeat protein [Planctomycetota bacterium]|nr:tetratricopeptide repeat protein [Planctomycetota bacterium]
MMLSSRAPVFARLFVFFAVLAALAFVGYTPSDAQDVEKARSLTVEGNKYFQQGDLVKAIELYTAATEQHSGYLTSYYQRSICYLQLGRYYLAHEDMTHVLGQFGSGTQIGGGSRDQAASLVQSMRGAVGLALGRYTEAVDDGQKAVQAWSLNPMANIVLGQALAIQGDPVKAEQYYLAARPHAGPKTFTNPIEVHVGLILSRLASGGADKALKAAQDLRNELPAEEATAWALEVVIRASTATSEVELDKALDLLKKAQKSNYRLFAEGVIYKRLGRNEAALASLREFDRAPFYLLARQTRGELEMLEGNIEKAHADLDPLLAVNPKVEEAVHKLPGGAEFLAGKGGKKPAKEVVAKTVSESREEEEQRNAFTQVSAEIRTSLRRYRFAAATAEAERLQKLMTVETTKERANRLAGLVKDGYALFKKLIDSVNKGKLSSMELEMGGVKAKLTSATEEELKFEFEGGQGAWAWGFVSVSGFYELASRLTLDGKEWVSLGELAWAMGNPHRAEQAFVKAYETKSLQEEVSRRWSETAEVVEPPGGFKPYKGKLVSAEEKTNLEKGLVLYLGQWVTPEDQAHLRKGHQKMKGKWVPLTEKQLIARGFTKVKGEWLSAQEVKRMRGDWESGWEKETAHFFIKTDKSEDFATRLAELGEVAYAEFEKFFGARSKGSPRLKLYAFADFEDYQKYCKDLKQDDKLAAAGFAPSEPHTACGWDKCTDDMMFLQTMVHEATHLYFAEKYPVQIPSWLAEGMATYFEGFKRENGAWKFDHVSRMRLTFMMTAIGERKFIPLDEFLSADAGQLINSDSSKALVFYSQAWAVFYFFNNTANQGYRDRFQAVFKKFQNGAAVIFTKEIDIDLKALEKELQQFVSHL